MSAVLIRERTIMTRDRYHDTDTLTYEPIPIP